MLSSSVQQPTITLNLRVCGEFLLCLRRGTRNYNYLSSIELFDRCVIKVEMSLDNIMRGQCEPLLKWNVFEFVCNSRLRPCPFYHEWVALTSLEDLEELQCRISDVLDVVSPAWRDIANVSGLLQGMNIPGTLKLVVVNIPRSHRSRHPSLLQRQSFELYPHCTEWSQHDSRTTRLYTNR